MAFPKSTQDLLDKYWAAETSPEEEVQLRAAFEKDDSSIQAAYFQFLNAESAKVMKTSVSPVTQTRRIVLKRTMSIAAAVLVLVVAGFLIQRSMITDIQQSTADTDNIDSYEDPMEAYEETKQALLMVSEKFNSSREMAEEKLEKAQPYVEILK
jgi:hypothetical protein